MNPLSLTEISTGVPHRLNAEQQRAFMETYGKLKQETGNNESILFTDGVYPTQGTKLAYGWMCKGYNAFSCGGKDAYYNN